MAKVTATCTTPPMVCEFSLICCLSPWELRSCDCELPVREREQTPVWQICHLIRAFCLPDEIHSFQLSPDCNSAEIKTSFGVKQSGWSCSAGVFQHCVFSEEKIRQRSLSAFQGDLQLCLSQGKCSSWFMSSRWESCHRLSGHRNLSQSFMELL